MKPEPWDLVMTEEQLRVFKKAMALVPDGVHFYFRDKSTTGDLEPSECRVEVRIVCESRAHTRAEVDVVRGK